MGSAGLKALCQIIGGKYSSIPSHRVSQHKNVSNCASFSEHKKMSQFVPHFQNTKLPQKVVCKKVRNSKSYSCELPKS